MKLINGVIMRNSHTEMVRPYVFIEGPAIYSAKRSVKIWTTNFCKFFSNGRLSKIRSVHTYGLR